MKTFAISVVSSICVLAALAWTQTSRAQVPVFQTTFSDANCAAWDQSMGLTDANICQTGDRISGNGGWTTSNGSNDQITSAANNPAGGGGKGFRHWVGDGLNNAGGGIVVQWTPTSEMWFRYYVRFQSGFTWSNVINMKTIYCNRNRAGTFYFGIFGPIGGHVQNDPGGGNHLSTVSWSQWQGGSTGDGNFHALEVHTKMNPVGGTANGVLEFWLDGNLIYSNSAVVFAPLGSDGAQFTNCAIGENHNNPQNGGVDAYVDFDDIAVSTTGYIGPTYGTPGAGSGAPKNLRVQ